MDHRTIETECIVERYVTGRLSAEETMHFEEYMLEHPECAAWVEDAERLQRGLATVAAEEVAGASILAGMAGLARRLRSHRLLIAAPVLGSVLIAAVSVALLSTQMRRVSGLEHQLHQALAPKANPAIIDLAALRAAQQTPQRITLPDEPTWLVLRVEVPPAPGTPTYSVRLAAAGGTELIAVDGLRTDPTGRLVLALPSAGLHPGAVELHIQMDTDVAAPARDVARLHLDLVRPQL